MIRKRSILYNAWDTPAMIGDRAGDAVRVAMGTSEAIVTLDQLKRWLADLESAKEES